MTDELSEAIRTLTKIEEHMIARNRALRSKAPQTIDRARRLDSDASHRRAETRLDDWGDPALGAAAFAELAGVYNSPSYAEIKLRRAALGVLGSIPFAGDWSELLEYPATAAYLEDLAGKLSNSHQLRA